MTQKNRTDFWTAVILTSSVILQLDLKLGLNMGELGYVRKATLLHFGDERLPDLIFMSHDLIFWETRVLFQSRVKQETFAKSKVKQRVDNGEKAETESCSSQKYFSFLLHLTDHLYPVNWNGFNYPFILDTIICNEVHF